MRLRSNAIFFVGLLVSAGFLWLALRGVDAGRTLAALRAAELPWAIPLLLSLAGFCLAKAWRWCLLLGMSTARGLPGLTRAVLIGYAGTSLLPLQLGELVRAWAATRALALPAAPVLISIALERVLDLLAVLLVVSAVLLVGGPLPEGLMRAGWAFAAAAAVLLAALVLYVVRTEQVLALAGRVCAFLPAGVQQRLQEQLRLGARGAQALRQPALWTWLAVSSLAQWAFMAACIAVSGAALGVHMPYAAAASVLGLTIVGMSLPAGPGYVGSIQLAFALGLAPFGVAASEAIAASVFYHVLVCGSLILAGVAALYGMGGSLQTLARADAPHDADTGRRTALEVPPDPR